MLTIFVRKDLSMRKGKMAAQSAHAAMKLFLEVMVPENGFLVLKNEQDKEFKNFLETPIVKIVMSKDENEFDNAYNKAKPYSVIVDNGRTEFHGIPTKTCAAQGIFEKTALNELHVPHTYGQEIKAKELFIFSKEKPLPKEKACELAVLSCLKMLYSQMVQNEKGEKCINLMDKSPLSAWITGAFGKIAVSTKTDEELKDLESLLSKKGFAVISCESEGNKCLVISPQYPEVIDEYTRHLSLI
ncbi:peptidyl-tRNA hydrolase [Shigella flexneri]